MPSNPHADDRILTAIIREWLAAHPLAPDQELDVHEVPESFFEMASDDERLQQLNRQIRKLPLQQQKLLLYLSRDLDPAIIIESMEYSSPELFWLDKALLIKEVDPTARQQDVLQVFRINESLVEAIYEVADQIDQEADKAKNRTYRKWSLIAAPVVLLLAFLFLYPVLVRPDPVRMYESFAGAYRPDPATVDTITDAGIAWQEALIRIREEDFAGAVAWLEEGVGGESPYRTGSRWFLALISLRSGDRNGCREQLSAIRKEDPEFFGRIAAPLWRELQRD